MQCTYIYALLGYYLPIQSYPCDALRPQKPPHDGSGTGSRGDGRWAHRVKPSRSGSNRDVVPALVFSLYLPNQGKGWTRRS